MAVVSAALVFAVIILVVVYVLWQLTPAQQLERHGPEDVHVYLDTFDLLIAVLVVGTAAVVLAGAATWLIAGRAVRPLAEAYRLQRTFVADASHELRTPLTVLSARAQQLQAMLPAATSERAVADALREDTRALAEVVEDLLATAAGRPMNVPKPHSATRSTARPTIWRSSPGIGTCTWPWRQGRRSSG